jgi:hypothetical protein
MVKTIPKSSRLMAKTILNKSKQAMKCEVTERKTGFSGRIINRNKKFNPITKIIILNESFELAAEIAVRGGGKNNDLK